MSATNKLDSQDRLVLIQVKIEWAKKHLRTLTTEINSLEHTTVLTRDKNTGVAPHPIILLHPHNFQTLPTLSFDVVTLAGDIVHNLRSALDHLARQLVLVGIEISPASAPLTEKDWRRIEFPIAETLSKYEAEKTRKIKGMLPEAVEAIDLLKPYKGGNDALWRIHELDNIDKHRHLFSVEHDFLFTSDWFFGAYWLKAENPNFSGIEPTVENDIQSEIEEALGQTQTLQPDALIPTLHQLANFVENLVIEFRPLLRNTYERTGS